MCLSANFWPEDKVVLTLSLWWMSQPYFKTSQEVSFLWSCCFTDRIHLSLSQPGASLLLHFTSFWNSYTLLLSSSLTHCCMSPTLYHKMYVRFVYKHVLITAWNQFKPQWWAPFSEPISLKLARMAGHSQNRILILIFLFHHKYKMFFSGTSF